MDLLNVVFCHRRDFGQGVAFFNGVYGVGGRRGGIAEEDEIDTAQCGGGLWEADGFWVRRDEGFTLSRASIVSFAAVGLSASQASMLGSGVGLGTGVGGAVCSMRSSFLSL